MLHNLPVVTCMTESALFPWTVVMPVEVHPKPAHEVQGLPSWQDRGVLSWRSPWRPTRFPPSCAARKYGGYSWSRPIPWPAPGWPRSAPASSPTSRPAGSTRRRALRHGATCAESRARGGGRALARRRAGPRTSPAPLRPAELARALRAAGTTAFVADAAGVGTTMYATPPGAVFAPRFGGASRARRTPRPAGWRSTCLTSLGCGATWTRQKTCARRSRLGSALGRRRSRVSC